MASPAAASRSRANAETGAKGSSWISLPATTGIHSSRSETMERIMRVFAWPRSPRKIRSWPQSSAFSTAGITVSS